MSINPSSCPDWCDPRTHVQRDVNGPEHRSAGMSWAPVAADTEITVRTSRLDEVFCGVNNAGSTYVSLSIEDTASLSPGGRAIIVETDLDPADARMLAAALVCEAERVEALLARAAVLR